MFATWLNVGHEGIAKFIWLARDLVHMFVSCCSHSCVFIYRWNGNGSIPALSCFIQLVSGVTVYECHSGPHQPASLSYIY